ncbi:MAG: DEAD/DEAH box helicase [Chromatiales bacterium]|nr:DEAD/DEAH box helicase [Chromatiales bacterium]
MSSAPPVYLNKADIRDAIGSSSFTRSLNYFQQGMVLRVAQKSRARSDGVLLFSLVRGSMGRNYSQQIRLEVDSVNGQVVDIEGECSCPVGYNCKHVGAALLSWIASHGETGTNAFDERRTRQWLEALISAGSTQGAPEDDRRITLVLHPSHSHNHRLVTHVVEQKRLKSGAWGKPRDLQSRVWLQLAQTHDRSLARIVQLLDALGGRWSHFPLLDRDIGELALEEILRSGLCHWSSPDAPPLSPGPARILRLDWQKRDSGVTPTLAVEGESELFLVQNLWYLDKQAAICGPVDTNGLNERQVRLLLEAPLIGEKQQVEVSETLLRTLPQVPPPITDKVDDIAVAEPLPVLRLTRAPGDQDLCLELGFDYGGHRLPARPALHHAVLHLKKGYVRIHRDLRKEAAAAQRLDALGLATSPGPASSSVWKPAAENRLTLIMAWERLVEQTLPELEKEGWRIEKDEGAAFRILSPTDEDWFGEIEEGTEPGWFDLSLGFEMEGRRIALLPILHQVLAASDDLARLRNHLQDHDLLTEMKDGPWLRLPGKRLLPILNTLVELYDQPTDSQGRLRISQVRAGQLERLGANKTGAIQWYGGERVRTLGKRLHAFQELQPVAPPEGLQAQLRDYQQQGLNWLNFLRELEVGGILADDMGLGKTVQALAWLLLEKESGRADRPSLIVMPTSLLSNWQREAERFAPALKVLRLHGLQRGDDFDRIAEHDLVLTTYPLLPRDAEALLTQAWHALVLDEAQNIKNPKAKASQLVRTLNSRHRLCLTGTPMENHLGELWAQFDFLLPGLLGDSTQFQRLFRTPVEKHGDLDRRQSLQRRVAPFLLRRAKEQVAAELPPKTEILQTVSLGPKQAELYETIRLSMEKQVRKAIASKGLARSQIMVLDALLKLRQSCCDPRLLKLNAAKTVRESAKLELLMNLLPEMLEEGRRVLLFSQFATMLGIIAAQLDEARIAYAKLTGQTRKRDEVIDRFRNGDADVFLVSLKTGGVGLNLTEADTVIHYDPWWNPAVEAQATDRAHRIGQDKPVFVYKLIAEGTVEEKILALQERKAELARGVYKEGGGAMASTLSQADLDELFRPLGE